MQIYLPNYQIYYKSQSKYQAKVIQSVFTIARKKDQRENCSQVKYCYGFFQTNENGRGGDQQVAVGIEGVYSSSGQERSSLAFPSEQTHASASRLVHR